MTQTAGQGRGIYMLMYAAEMDACFGGSGAPSVYPTTNSVSSTAYFNSGASDMFADTGPSFFSSPGIPWTTNWPMRSEHNAWCLNVSFTNAEYAAPGVPFLFTRNLHFELRSNGQVRPYLTSERPFGKHGAVVVTFGGATMKLLQKDLHLVTESARASDVGAIIRP